MLGAVEKRSLTKHQSLEIWKALVFFRQTATLSMVNVWWNWHRCCLKTPLGCILLTHCWATCWDHTQDFSLDTSHVVKCVQCRTYIAGYIYFLYIYIYRYRYIHTRTHTHTHIMRRFSNKESHWPLQQKGAKPPKPGENRRVEKPGLCLWVVARSVTTSGGMKWHADAVWSSFGRPEHPAVCEKNVIFAELTLK